MAADGHALEKLSVLVVSGDFARVHYALVLAAGAAATGLPVTLFFSLEACRALVRDAGWRTLAGAGADADYRARGVAGFEDLLVACHDLGVRLIVCEMGLRALGLATADLRDDLAIDVAGVVTFLADARAGGALATL